MEALRVGKDGETDEGEGYKEGARRLSVLRSDARRGIRNLRVIQVNGAEM